MAKRSKSSQGTHDRTVRSVARALKKKGYNVRADLTEYDSKPKAIGRSN